MNKFDETFLKHRYIVIEQSAITDTGVVSIYNEEDDELDNFQIPQSTMALIRILLRTVRAEQLR